MLIPGSVRLKRTSPTQHVYCYYGVDLPLCVSRFRSICCQSNRIQQRSFCCLSLPPVFLRPSVSLCHVFHISGMSMCYLLTLCMNDNMSVYSYRELYPISPGVHKKNGLNVVQIQIFLRLVSFLCIRRRFNLKGLK